MIPNETTWECETCGAFNLTEAFVIRGLMYCVDCHKKLTQSQSSKKQK